MSRKQMIEVKCDRCKRVEYVPIKKEKKEEASLDLEFKPSAGGTHGRIKLKFNDLCSPCEKTIKNLIESIAREIKGKSPDRKSDAKKEGDDDAAPSIEVTGATQPSSAAPS